jgi:HAD superfamily hydrolase (TIGR01459 family)
MQVLMSDPLFLDHFAILARDYDVLLCDVWGVIHNGVSAFPDAYGALQRARQGGATVMLLTNSPRPCDAVMLQIAGLGVPRDSYDGMVTSGDVTRAVIAERPGQSVFHLGPPRDLPVFAGLDLRLTDAETAAYVVCTGLFDDTRETPEDYRGLLAKLKARGLFMVCANPDVVVERGDQLVYCAGALADLYHDMGGDVLYAGKPYPPIYQRALAQAEALRIAKIPLQRVLAIGDSVRTDLKGAAMFGVDCVFIQAGIHAGEVGSRKNTDPETLRNFFAQAGMVPKAVMPRLIW